ncbi:MAG: response regulator [Colwellia sp.]|nr:response regulator [Colwellia sp.]
MIIEKKVLIVDDEVGVRNTLIRGIKRKFNKTNQLVSITEASNGQEAIELANISPPDLILMDIRMPVMNGLKACKLLRRDTKFAATKIIILTCEIMEESAGLLSGADDFVIKPFDIKTLLIRIERGLFQSPPLNKIAPAYLNGLLSKECFFDICLNFEIARAKRFQRPLSLLLLKISPKEVDKESKQNQAFILTLLKRRASDKVINWAKNTFAILLTETTADDAALVAKHIVSRVDNSPDFFRTSVGIANLEDTLTDNIVVNAESSLKESVRTGDITLNRKAIH